MKKKNRNGKERERENAVVRVWTEKVRNKITKISLVCSAISTQTHTEWERERERTITTVYIILSNLWYFLIEIKSNTNKKSAPVSSAFWMPSSSSSLSFPLLFSFYLVYWLNSHCTNIFVSLFADGRIKKNLRRNENISRYSIEQSQGFVAYAYIHTDIH